MKERLQKLISRAGLTSRRQAEVLIAAGRVTVDGVPAALGQSADPATETVAVDGAPLRFPKKHTYILLHKPPGYVTTLSDEKGRKNVSALVRSAGVRLYPVGRLDMWSEGLLLMTDDGETAHSLMHPRHGVDKTYHAWVTGEDLEASLAAMARPMDIDGHVIRPAGIERLGREGEREKIVVTIHEGRNRQIRKMCALCHLKLHRLVRVAEGALELGDLESGRWRYLTPEEIRYLQEEI